MIDIIIPAYNAQEYINVALTSLVKQTIKDKVIVTIIDDGSKDKYDEIIKEYQKELKINLIRLKKNHGVGYAREMGIKRTNNSYIFFLDADDKLIKKNALELLYKKIKEDKKYQMIIGKEKVGKNISFYENHILAKLIKREVITKYKIKVPNLIIGEDTAFIFSIFSLLEKEEYIYVDELIYVHHKVNSKSLTSIYLKNSSYDEYFKAIDYAYKYARRNHKFEYFKNRIIYIMEYLTYLYFNKFKSTDIEIREKYLRNARHFYNKYQKYLIKIEIASKNTFTDDEYNKIMHFYNILKNYNR